jgi:hypothetical protein
MGDNNWILNQVGACVTKWMTEEVFLVEILPIISNARRNNMREEEFEENLSSKAESNLLRVGPIRDTLSCINAKVLYQAIDIRLPAFEGEYLLLTCAVFARYWCRFCQRVGYISF